MKQRYDKGKCMMKKNLILCGLILLIGIPSKGFSDFIVNPGETYTLTFTNLPLLTDVFPGYPTYDQSSYHLYFSGDLYQNPPDSILIRLYEDPADISPLYSIFGPSANAPNLSVSPTKISMTYAPGTLWHDGSGRIEVEVLAGSVNIDHSYFDLGFNSISHTAYVEAVPEPSSLALLVIGSGALYRLRRRKTNDIRIPTCTIESPPETF